MHSRSRAFSLLEMLAVVAICALMAGVAVIGIRSQRNVVTFDETVRAIADYDRSARLYAERLSQPVQLDIARTGLRSSCAGEWDQVARPSLEVGSAYTVRDVWCAGEPYSQDPDAAVQIGQNGRSSSYAVHLLGPNHASRWVVTCGITGQQFFVEDDAQVQSIFALLSRGRVLAD